jgi:hypothetical protein
LVASGLGYCGGPRGACHERNGEAGTLAALKGGKSQCPEDEAGETPASSGRQQPARNTAPRLFAADYHRTGAASSATMRRLEAVPAGEWLLVDAMPIAGKKISRAPALWADPVTAAEAPSTEAITTVVVSNATAFFQPLSPGPLDIQLRPSALCIFE